MVKEYDKSEFEPKKSYSPTIRIFELIANIFKIVFAILFLVLFILVCIYSIKWLWMHI